MLNKAVENIAKFGLFLLLICSATMVAAQSRFEMAVRGGASMLMYQSDFGQMQPSYDFGVDLLYNYRSPHVVGFRGGVSFDFAQSKFHIAGYEDSYEVVNYQNNKQVISYSIADLTESHNQIYASVPLQLGLNFGNFAIFLGPKIAFPLKATFKQELTDVDVKVLFPEYGVTVNGNEKVYDFNEEHNSRYFSVAGPIENTPAFRKNSINIFASLDINYYVPISKNSSFGIGLYVDYGLPLYNNAPVYNASAPYKSSVLWINDPKDASCPTMTREHTSVLDAFNLQATETQEPQEAALVKKFNYLSCGIRLSFNIGGVRKDAVKHQYKDTKVCRCVFTN